MSKYQFHVSGLRCQSCVIRTEGKLKDLPQVTEAHTSLSKNTVTIFGDFGDRSPEDIAKLLSAPLLEHGYALSVEKTEVTASWSEFRYALPSALLFVGFFLLLQKMGIVNMGGTGEVTLGTAFVVGLIASVSTCMAVVGGLALSLSANYAKEGETKKPQALFHVGRLVAFPILGGLVGMLGSAFQLGAMGTFVLSIVVVMVLLVLGLNLLDVFPWAKRLQLTMPAFIGKRAMGVQGSSHFFAPVLLGVATFFLPCGFTQAMQFYALSTGSFTKGALVMFFFALGTFPVLALLSFTTTGIQDKTKLSIFFKSAGLVVIFFALFQLINSLVAYGLIRPVFNF